MVTMAYGSEELETKPTPIIYCAEIERDGIIFLACVDDKKKIPKAYYEFFEERELKDLRDYERYTPIPPTDD